MKTRIYLLYILIGSILLGCAKDKIDLTKISKDVRYEGGLVMPAVYGSFKLSDLFDPSNDSSNFIVTDESINYVLNIDSVVNFSIDDFMDSESTMEDLIDGFTSLGSDFFNPVIVDFPVIVDTNIILDSVSFYPQFNIAKGVDIDSILIDQGQIEFTFYSTYETTAILHYWSDSSIYLDGELAQGSFILNGSGTYHESIPLDGSTITFKYTMDSSMLQFDLKYALELQLLAGETLSSTGTAGVNMAIEDLNEFKYVYGYFGNHSVKEFSDADEFDIEIPEESREQLNKISGTLNIGNPKIKFNYYSSFGIEEAFNLGIKATYNDNSVNQAVFDEIVFKKPVTISTNEYYDSTFLNGSALNSILDFPLAEKFSLVGNIIVNPSGRVWEHNYINYISPESKLGLDLEVDLPLQLGANLQFRDTLLLDSLFGEMEDSIKINEYVDWMRINYTFENGFPLGFSATAIIYNTEAEQVYDTILLNFTDQNFLEPAPVNDDGTVTENMITEGYAELTAEQVEILSTDANSLILVVKINTTGQTVSGNALDNVNILPDYGLSFDFSVAVQFNYQDELEL